MKFDNGKMIKLLVCILGGAAFIWLKPIIWIMMNIPPAQTLKTSNPSWCPNTSRKHPLGTDGVTIPVRR